MPHISIKHFPVDNPDLEMQLRDQMLELIASAFECHRDVISIALEPIEQDQWDKEVYQPEIVNKFDLLIKKPNY